MAPNSSSSNNSGPSMSKPGRVTRSTTGQTGGPQGRGGKQRSIIRATQVGPATHHEQSVDKSQSFQSTTQQQQQQPNHAKHSQYPVYPTGNRSIQCGHTSSSIPHVPNPTGPASSPERVSTTTTTATPATPSIPLSVDMFHFQEQSKRRSTFPSNPRQLKAPTLLSKRRVGKACDMCRSKKTKCDGVHPCSKCSLENRICSYTERIKTEKMYPQHHVEMLESRVRLLSHCLEGMFLKAKNREDVRYLCDEKDGSTLRINALIEELGLGGGGDGVFADHQIDIDHISGMSQDHEHSEFVESDYIVERSDHDNSLIPKDLMSNEAGNMEGDNYQLNIDSDHGYAGMSNREMSENHTMSEGMLINRITTDHPLTNIHGFPSCNKLRESSNQSTHADGYILTSSSSPSQPQAHEELGKLHTHDVDDRHLQTDVPISLADTIYSGQGSFPPFADLE